MDFATDKPVYLQIVDLIITRIITEEYLSDQKIPTVRGLAKELNVNHNTIQRAFFELETLNIIETRKTSGRYVTKDTALLKELRQKLASQHAKKYIKKMEQLKFSSDEIINYVRKATK